MYDECLPGQKKKKNGINCFDYSATCRYSVFDTGITGVRKNGYNRTRTDFNEFIIFSLDSIDDGSFVLGEYEIESYTRTKRKMYAGVLQGINENYIDRVHV